MERLVETLLKVYPELAAQRHTPHGQIALARALAHCGLEVSPGEDVELAALPFSGKGLPRGPMAHLPQVARAKALIADWPMYDFARLDAAELAVKGFGVAAYEMGLGKTRLGLAIAKIWGGEVAVVAPARLIPVWQAELAKVPSPPKVRLFSYEEVRREEPDLRGYTGIIADEAHRLRNTETLTYETLSRLSPTKRVALTATPMGGVLRQLRGVFSWVGAGWLMAGAPDLLQGEDLSIQGLPLFVEKFRSALKVRTREDPEVQSDIAATYRVVRRDVPITLPDDLLRFYLAQVRNVWEWWRLDDSEARARRGLWRLVKASTYPERYGWTGPNPVMAAVVAEALPGDVIFVKYKDFGRHLASLLGAHFVHGGVPLKRRMRIIHAFRQSPDSQILVGTYGTIAEGYDLPEAKRVILAEPSWDAIEVIQATGRLTRPGRTSPEVEQVVVYAVGTAAHYAFQLVEVKLKNIRALQAGADQPERKPSHKEMLTALVARANMF